MLFAVVVKQRLIFIYEEDASLQQFSPNNYVIYCTEN